MGNCSSGKRFAESGPEAEHGPRGLVAGRQDVGKLAGRQRARFDGIDLASIETGAGARNLIRQVHGTALADEVFVPAHAPVWSGFPGLAAEAASVHHDHRHMRIRVHRDLVLHVHLIDRDVAALGWSGRGASSGRGRRSWDRLRLPTHKETPLFGQHQRFLKIVGSPNRQRQRHRGQEWFHRHLHVLRYIIFVRC